MIGDLLDWWRGDEPAGLATVVAGAGPTPRAPGAAMAVGPGGRVVGSLSGGCVEGAVYESAVCVAAGGRPVLERYGAGDLFTPGLGCGGSLDVYVERVDQRTFPQLGEVAADLSLGRAVALATVVSHPDPARVGRRLVVRSDRPAEGGLGSARADGAVHDDALGLLAAGTSTTVEYGPDGERLGVGMRVFVDAHAPRARMLVFGAVDFAAAVSRMGGFLGYRVTVCDARPVFATAARFSDAEEVVADWPPRYLAAELAAGRLDARTVVVVLTHDDKVDVPLLDVALRAPLAFVGAMGSRSVHERRTALLREAGVTETQLARLASPVGLDLGGRTPEETAVSIAAQIVASRWGGTGVPLVETAGRIHGGAAGNA